KDQIKVVDILCDIELIYLPALFDIMIHLVIHLPLEALEGGPIHPGGRLKIRQSVFGEGLEIQDNHLVKHLFGGVVRAMMSPSGFIVASHENINGFLAVNTPPDDLIRTNFEQEGVIPKVMLHIFEEFVLLLGRHPFHNKVPCMVKGKQEKDKIGLKPDKNEKRGEAGKSQKQLQ
nr:hypothetical protein [Tanacetum cinerariifolium]